MKLKNLLILLTLISISGIFLIGHIGLPQDINAEVLSNVLAAKWSFEAHQAGVSVLPFFQNIFNQWSSLFEPKSMGLFSSFFIYYFYIFVHPLSQLTVTLFLNIFGFNYQSVILHSIFYGFLTILATYFLGKKIYDKKVAFWGAIFLATSLPFIIQLRIGYIMYAPTVFLTATGLCFFILAHKTKEVKWLWASGLIFTGHLLVAYFGLFLVPLIMGLFIAWEIFKKNKFLFPIKNYLLIFLVSFLLYLALSVSYSWFYGGQTFEVLTKTTEHLFSRHPYTAGGIEAHFATTGRFLKAVFYDMDVPGTHRAQYMNGKPMINFIVAIFFFAGLFLAAKRRNVVDRFMFSWLAVVFIVYGFILDFQHRYVALAFPAIYLLAGQGVIFFWRRARQFALKLLLVLIIFAALAMNYYDYYIVFARQDFNLWRYHGQAEMSEYIKNNFNPKTTFIMFGDKTLMPYGNFLVKTWDDNYKIQYWQNVTANFSSSQELEKWQNETFKNFETIVYIFTPDNQKIEIPGREPGPYFTDWALFKNLYPEHMPAKTIYYSSGVPEMMMYVVKR